MSNEKKYANGLFAKKIEFQNGGSMTKLSIKVEDFVSFLEENAQNGWVNLDLKSKKDANAKFNLYAELNEFKAEPKKDAPAEKSTTFVKDDEDLPF